MDTFFSISIYLFVLFCARTKIIPILSIWRVCPHVQFSIRVVDPLKYIAMRRYYVVVNQQETAFDFNKKLMEESSPPPCLRMIYDSMHMCVCVYVCIPLCICMYMCAYVFIHIIYHSHMKSTLVHAHPFLLFLCRCIAMTSKILLG